ncbi:MAG: hypothetical protein LBI73_10710 [Myroides sp.]|jgi:arginine/lysine/ornithine decarboxylase|nr:hypothetical protein [Myroides sp.]
MKNLLLIVTTLLILLSISCQTKKSAVQSKQDLLVEVKDVDRDIDLLNKYIDLLQQYAVAYKQKDDKKIDALLQEVEMLTEEFAAIDYSKISDEQLNRVHEAAKAFQDAVLESSYEK